MRQQVFMAMTSLCPDSDGVAPFVTTVHSLQLRNLDTFQTGQEGRHEPAAFVPDDICFVQWRGGAKLHGVNMSERRLGAKTIRRLGDELISQLSDRVSIPVALSDLSDRKKSTDENGQ